MSTWIDWHSHHTAPEVAQRIVQFIGREPHIDKFDSPDFSERIKEIDEVGLELAREKGIGTELPIRSRPSHTGTGWRDTF